MNAAVARVRTTRHTVSCLPEDSVDHHHWTITVGRSPWSTGAAPRIVCNGVTAADALAWEAAQS